MRALLVHYIPPIVSDVKSCSHRLLTNNAQSSRINLVDLRRYLFRNKHSTTNSSNLVPESVQTRIGISRSNHSAHMKLFCIVLTGGWLYTCRSTRICVVNGSCIWLHAFLRVLTSNTFYCIAAWVSACLTFWIITLCRSLLLLVSACE